jgi:murein DD-endopeptidase MepM/ murein hydrolase activator NlpD
MKFLAFIFSLYLLIVCGCATAPSVAPRPAPGVPGFYHKMERGQTLWRISKMYNIDLDELVSINRISDVTNIEIGQLIFIPQAKKQIVPIPVNSDDFTWPVNGKVISGFGQTFRNMINKGVNIQVSGERDVVVSRSGRVVFYSPEFKGYGKTIIIDHGDGFSTVYSGVWEVFITPGDAVSQGKPIAKIKNSYLHFEIRKAHIPQNPYFYLQ